MFLKLKQTINQLINSQHAFQRWNFEAIDMPLSSQRLEQYQRLIKQVTSNIQFAMTAPVIWAGIIPALLLDLFVTVYQYSCFPVYGINKVKRADYFRYEREQLQYLTLLEKINCYYCSYFNELVAYTSEVAARTESYWCPLKHKTRLSNPHRHYKQFAEFGDEACFRHKKD